MDYGFHTGSLVYRGHFSANGRESYIWLNISGGTGFGHSVWLDDTFLGSWTGTGSNATITQNLTFPTALSSGTQHVLSILIDNMGQDEEAPGTDAIKFPHGILGFQLSNHEQSDVSWKLTGNLGGEQYRDLARGPLNEGAMYAERQGYHYPSPPDSKWEVSSPFTSGLSKAGVGFYTTSFRLDIPDGWDVPLSIVLNNSTRSDSSQKTSGLNYRCQLYINGYQYGKYSKLSPIDLAHTSHELLFMLTPNSQQPRTPEVVSGPGGYPQPQWSQPHSVDSMGPGFPGS
jgi:beta-galactosidase